MSESTNIFSLIIKDYFILLDNKNIKYCVIGNYYELPDHTSNDVDVWVDDFLQAESLLLSLAKNYNLTLYMQNKTANGSNNYFYRETEGGNFEIVKIDLMREVAYMSIFPIIESSLIKANRKLYKFFFVANDELEAVLHLIYPLATFGVVKEKYRKKFVSYAHNKIFISYMQAILGIQLGRKILDSVKSEDWATVVRTTHAVRKRLILRTFLSFDCSRAIIFFDFLKSIIRRSFVKNGIVVAFTGVDGAGKTTIKNTLIQHSDKFFPKQKCVQYYWRPFLFPRISTFFGGKGQIEKYDQKGIRLINNSKAAKIKNLLKYFYYIFDFIFGKIKYFRVLHTGGLVIFDRYHFDNIIYPERFGFNVNKNFMRFIDKYFIPYPDIIFYFTANTDTLFNRKMELAKEEIISQKFAYQNEIQLNKKFYTVHTDREIYESMNSVLLACLRKMGKRYAKSF